MDVYALDPLRDARWDGFVARHSRSSVFHTSQWLRALRTTYGYEPIAFTTSPPTAELTNALVACVVRSWLTGDRLVSLPFSDHCEPLVDTEDELLALAASVDDHRARNRLQYVEVRPRSPAVRLPERYERTQTFYLHRLDLGPELDVLLHRFHKDSIQRKIRRAERERLTYEAGRSEAMLQKLCRLLEATRLRHQVPLQPMSWFRNLIECFGDRLSIHIASKDDQPVAGILTLAHRHTVVYKYGGSDARLNALGGTPLLFWNAIRNAKRDGAEEFDFGRSDCDNPGLIVFKDRWAARRSDLSYWRSPAVGGPPQNGRAQGLARSLFSLFPRGIRLAVGRILYRHMG